MTTRPSCIVSAIRRNVSWFSRRLRDWVSSSKSARNEDFLRLIELTRNPTDYIPFPFSAPWWPANGRRPAVAVTCEGMS